MTREVPRELIEDCLRMAMHAPIGSNGLYPHFMVVTDAAVARFYKEAWDAYLPLPFSAANLHFEDPAHEAQQAPVVSSTAYLADHMADVPALVIPCSRREDFKPAYREPIQKFTHWDTW
jgi:nitroreductase